MDLVPISAFGGGVIAIPWENVLLSVLVLDPSGTPTNNDVSEAFQDGIALVAGGKVTIKPFGLVGHQQLGGLWSNKTRLDLSQDPSNVSRMLLTNQFPLLGDPGPRLERFLSRFFPQLLVPVQPARKTDSTWAMYYGFDQYLWLMALISINLGLLNFLPYLCGACPICQSSLLSCAAIFVGVLCSIELIGRHAT